MFKLSSQTQNKVLKLQKAALPIKEKILITKGGGVHVNAIMENVAETAAHWQARPQNISQKSKLLTVPSSLGESRFFLLFKIGVSSPAQYLLWASCGYPLRYEQNN